MPHVCIYAASSRRLDPEYYAAAESLGTQLGQLGWDLVFGGANIGLMNAAARGFKSVGRRVISVIPHIFDRSGLTFAPSDQVLLTDDLRQRKRIMAEHADAFLTWPGGPGTLDEFYETLTLAQLKLIEKPIVLFNFRGHFAGTLQQLETAVTSGFADPKLLEALSVVDTVDQAVRKFAALAP